MSTKTQWPKSLNWEKDQEEAAMKVVAGVENGDGE